MTKIAKKAIKATEQVVINLKAYLHNVSARHGDINLCLELSVVMRITLEWMNHQRESRSFGCSSEESRIIMGLMPPILM